MAKKKKTVGPVLTSAAERKLYNAKDPHEFIDLSLRLMIPQGRKAYISYHWLRKTGFVNKDLQHARHRHPYWKQQKFGEHDKNTTKRFRQHDYRIGGLLAWTIKDITTFLKMNVKCQDTGKYKYRDWEIAQKLERTIPSIQSFRRKHNLLVRLYGEKRMASFSPRDLCDLLQTGENQLRDECRRRRIQKRK